MRSGCSGFTLVEVLVVLLLLGIVASVAVAALPATDARTVSLDRTERARAGRAHAIEHGTLGTLQLDTGHFDEGVFLPDGRAIGRGIDPLSGQVRGR